MQPRPISEYPDRLYAKDMAALFGLGLKRFYQLEATGTFVAFEERPRINRKAWLRSLVARHLAGEVVQRASQRRRFSPEQSRQSRHTRRTNRDVHVRQSTQPDTAVPFNRVESTNEGGL